MYQGIRAKPGRRNSGIRYQDYLSREWVRLHGPCRWQGRVEIKFRDIPYRQLEPAGSWKRPEVVSKWLQKLRRHEPVPPPIVCPTGRGTYYVREGNHRHEAIGLFLREMADTARIRVAVAVPRRGFRFRYRWFGTYGTYLLEAKSSRHQGGSGRRQQGDKALRREGPPSGLEPLLHRTLVIASHPDDETACAGLLQRIREPAVLFLTDGAPAAEFFWRNYGSRENYAAVRRAEAVSALGTIGISQAQFLNDSISSRPFHDQELYKRLPEAILEVERRTERLMPDALLVPAYEGGHPDHDVCSFLGHVVGSRLGLAVWEMPLYHRSSSGSLVHRQFVSRNGSEVRLQPSPRELRKQSCMVAAYASQQDLEEYLASRVELYRPQAAYDYGRPPYPWKLNYEAWEWPITGEDICRALRRYWDEEPASHLLWLGTDYETPLPESMRIEIGRAKEPAAAAAPETLRASTSSFPVTG